MRHDLILRVIAKLLIPFILLFGLYVQFHGDFGPGGGFQAGVIMAAAVIFYALIFGLADARKVVPEPLVESMMAIGVLIYAGVGVAGVLLGGNYLDYFVLGRDPIAGQHRGIFWVEVGVAITVSGVMLKVFYMFAGRGKVDRVTGAGLLDDAWRPRHLLHHDLPDDRGTVHRHRARKSDQEAGRAEHLPDLGISAVHRARASWLEVRLRSSARRSPSIRIRCRTC